MLLLVTTSMRHVISSGECAVITMYFTADLDDAHDKMGLQGNVWIPKKGSGNINQKRKQVFAIVTCQTHT